MRKRYALAGIGAVALALLTILNIATPIAPTNDDMATIGVKLVIEVHRANGETEKYVKEGDLILKNFANILVSLLQDQDPDGENKYTITSGSLYNVDDTAGGGIGQICIGDGTTAATLNDYALASQIACFGIQDADIIVNGTDMTVDVFGSYTTDTAINVTEVGLVTKGLYNNGRSAMIFRDVLASPIQLNAGDGITVHYYIFLDNP